MARGMVQGRTVVEILAAGVRHVDGVCWVWEFVVRCSLVGRWSECFWLGLLRIG